MEIQWEDPSPDALFRAENRGGKYVEFALALKGHPGRWAVLPDSDAKPRDLKQAQTLSQNVRNGKVAGFKKGEYEVILDDASGSPKIHVRYVEPAQGASPKGAQKAAEKPAAPASPKAREHDLAGLADPEDDEDEEEHVDPVEVRAWAKNNNHQLAERGRIPRDTLNAYLEDRRQRRAAARADLANEVA